MIFILELEKNEHFLNQARANYFGLKSNIQNK